MAGSSATGVAPHRDPKVAILTRTVVRSPVIRWILPARIRHAALNDVVYVGDDFIEVKQVRNGGHLDHIATKTDFGCRIRAAKTFSIDSDSPEDVVPFLKPEDEDLKFDGSAPAELLVLSLDCDDLVFLYLQRQEDGIFRFVYQKAPLPQWDDSLHQAGEHLAVDPKSRAVAVAAREGEITICTAKSKQSIRDEIQRSEPNWSPVRYIRAVHIEGVIQHIDFLNPPTNLSDQIMLLVIVIHQRKTKAIYVEAINTPNQYPQISPALPIKGPASVSSLLIPLRDANFLLVNGATITFIRGILSRSLTSTDFPKLAHDPEYPGNSPKAPVYANWCRPRRNTSSVASRDIVYLAREDGVVILLDISNNGNLLSYPAGHLVCHVGEAFATLGDPSGPDILAVAGDMSSGRIVTIGLWADSRRLDEISREDTMEMLPLELIPNWASVTDMITSTLPPSHGNPARLRDGIFITSGRQPFGVLTEVRKGLEARMAHTMFQPQDLRAIIDLWILPNPPTGSLLILLSSPTNTRLYEMTGDKKHRDIEEKDAQEASSFVLDQRTLAADVSTNGHLFQVTEKSISIAVSLDAGFEDRCRRVCKHNSSILAAAIEPGLGIILCAEKHDKRFHIACYKHIDQDSDSAPAFEDGPRAVGSAIDVDTEPLCIATTRVNDYAIVLVTTASGQSHLFKCSDTGLQPILNLPMPSGDQNVSDYAALLRPKAGREFDENKIIAICGLRNGRIFTFTIHLGAEQIIQHQKTIEFGQSTVKLIRHSSEADRIYAMSGPDFCLITVDESSKDHLDIHNIWLSDTPRPYLKQGGVSACTKMPDYTFHLSEDLIDSLVVLSEDELSFTFLDAITKTVPRQIQVEGTPSRLIYAASLRSWVSVSMCVHELTFPSHQEGVEPKRKRQLYPVIDFIPSSADHPTFSHLLQAGEKVNALREWTVKIQNDQTYSHLLVVGSCLSKDFKKKGKVTLLQPVSTNRRIVRVDEKRSWSFEEPVSAVELYDELTFVVSSGEDIVAYRYSLEAKRWNPICRPYKLGSSGMDISCSQPLLHVSTRDDSVITLRLEASTSDEDGAYDYRLVPHASAPEAEPSLAHTVVELRSSEHINGNTAHGDSSIVLASTKNRRLLGLTTGVPSSSVTPLSRSSHTLFDALLPRSLMRLRKCNIRPLWKQSRPKGVRFDNVIGCAADGTIVGLSIIDQQLWRRLFWLQRLCDWSTTISPHSYDQAPYTTTSALDREGTERVAFRKEAERVFPIGLGASSEDEILLFADADQDSACDMHVDGDVLARLFDHGGAMALRDAIEQVAQQRNRVGAWIREHREQELAAVEELVADLRVLLGSWL